MWLLHVADVDHRILTADDCLMRAVDGLALTGHAGPGSKANPTVRCARVTVTAGGWRLAVGGWRLAAGMSNEPTRAWAWGSVKDARNNHVDQRDLSPRHVTPSGRTQVCIERGPDAVVCTCLGLLGATGGGIRSELQIERAPLANACRHLTTHIKLPVISLNGWLMQAAGRVDMSSKARRYHNPKAALQYAPSRSRQGNPGLRWDGWRWCADRMAPGHVHDGDRCSVAVGLSLCVVRGRRATGNRRRATGNGIRATQTTALSCAQHPFHLVCSHYAVE